MTTPTRHCTVHTVGRITSTKPGSEPIDITLHYHPDQPFEVQVTLRNSDDSDTWLIDRSLLTAGTASIAGLADVQVWPDGTQTVLRLDGTHPDLPGPVVALVRIKTGVLRRFLADTQTLVPVGRERLDVDTLIAQLLESR